MICPKDLQPCCDSLCRSSLTCFETGESMMDLCPGGCGQLVSVDGSDRDDCQCDADYDDVCLDEDDDGLDPNDFTGDP